MRAKVGSFVQLLFFLRKIVQLVPTFCITRCEKTCNLASFQTTLRLLKKITQLKSKVSVLSWQS